MKGTNDYELNYENDGAPRIYTNEEYKNLSDEEIDKMSDSFSEGNKGLKMLLQYTMKNGINTIASCGGHHENSNDPYVSFLVNDKNQEILSKIFEKQMEKNVEIVFLKNQDLHHIAIYVDPENSEKGFIDLKEDLKMNEKEVEKSKLFDNLVYIQKNAINTIEIEMRGRVWRNLRNQPVGRFGIEDNEYLAENIGYNNPGSDITVNANVETVTEKMVETIKERQKNNANDRINNLKHFCKNNKTMKKIKESILSKISKEKEVKKTQDKDFEVGGE